jgi:outer membrane protein
MKNFSLISNIILAAAVVVLFILHFTSGTKSAKSSSTVSDASNTALSGEFSVAWVNIDTVLNNYDMYFDMRKELEESGKKLEAELNSKTREFEKQAMDFQDKAQKGLETRSKLQLIQQELAEKEQELYRLRDEMRSQLAEDEQVKLRKIHYSITQFLEGYNTTKGYHIILSSTFGGPLLYGHPAIDITKDVLQGLNDNYITTNKSDEKNNK